MICDRCRSPLGAGDVALGDSYHVVPEKQRKLPELNPLASDDGMLAATSMHEQLRTVSRLLELTEQVHDKAASAAVGCPLCEDCASGVLGELKRQLEEAHAERELLTQSFAELEAGEEEEGDTIVTSAEFERELQQQRMEEERLRTSLSKASKERDALRGELERLRVEKEEQESTEGERHRALNQAELLRQELADETLRAQQLVDLCDREHDRLQSSDVIADVFTIDVDGAIGTINALRLGRLPGAAVEWTELNAALGQAVLLVHTLGRLHLPEGFAGHLLVPHGSFCRVYARKEPSKVYELYGTGRFGSGLFGGGRFERGQAMFLACVGELCAHASKRSAHGDGRPIPQPPFAVTDIGSLIGSSSAAEGRKLLIVLAWLIAAFQVVGSSALAGPPTSATERLALSG